jgi:hypothetical protein
MSALIWKAFELYFQLTKVLLPFPYTLDLTAKKLHYYKSTPLLTSKYFAWYCYGSLATSSLFFHSSLGLSQLGPSEKVLWLSYLRIVILLCTGAFYFLALSYFWLIAVHGEFLPLILWFYRELDMILQG